MSPTSDAVIAAAELTANAVSQASVTQAELVATEAAVVAAAVAVAAAAEAAISQEDVVAAEAAAAAATVAAAAASARAEVSAASAVAAATVAAAAAAARARASAAASAAGNAEVAARAASQAAAGVEDERNRQAVHKVAVAREAAETFAAGSASSGDAGHSRDLAIHLAAIDAAEAELSASDAAVAAATAVSQAVEVAAASAAMAVVASAAEFERSVVSTAMAAANLATHNAAVAASAVLVGTARTADLAGFGSAETPLFVQLVAPARAVEDDQRRALGDPAAVARGDGQPESSAANTRSRARIDVDTHEVSVRIDDVTGDYALACQSCEWEAPRGATTLHSWRQRGLDRVLLTHVDFGNLLAAPQAPAPPASHTESKRYPQNVSGLGRPDVFGPRQQAKPPSRRRFLTLGGWLRP